ncbi:hypothetical protein [Anaeromicrobium sediminis]|uniref:Uncharacterized protein n=1 Tax=Anaeromicrobium sediminis TaxID=1478221 RepID=A0A267MMF6_9FIRM|nr:hypothetical protein [Anaeromicrobium sediminis]PAB59930.1 hypothetical protein CCE28_08225 [Anaeromicrobium sediminis]
MIYIVMLIFLVSMVIYTIYCRKNKLKREMIIGNTFIIISTMYSYFYMVGEPLPGPTEGINMIFAKIVNAIYGVTL